MTRYVDGQKQPRPPAMKLDLLDGAGVDLRLTPQPLVFEASLDEFIAAGGWIATIPAELEGNA